MVSDGQYLAKMSKYQISGVPGIQMVTVYLQLQLYGDLQVPLMHELKHFAGHTMWCLLLLGSFYLKVFTSIAAAAKRKPPKGLN